MNEVKKDLIEFFKFVDGEITEEQYTQSERQYQLTEKDITEMQSEADRELFGTY